MNAFTIEVITLSVAAVTFLFGTLFHYKEKRDSDFYFAISGIAVVVFTFTLIVSFMASLAPAHF